MTAKIVHAEQAHEITEPDTKISVRDVFGIDTDMVVPAFSEISEHVPD